MKKRRGGRKMPAIAHKTLNDGAGIIIPFRAKAKQQKSQPRANPYQKLHDQIKPLHMQSKEYRESSARAARDEDDFDDED